MTATSSIVLINAGWQASIVGFIQVENSFHPLPLVFKPGRKNRRNPRGTNSVSRVYF